MPRRPCLPCLALAVLAMLVVWGAAPAWGADDLAARQLAQKYSPIVMLKAQSGECDTNGEAFGPSPVNPLLGNPAIALERDGGEVRRAPTGADINGLGATSSRALRRKVIPCRDIRATPTGTHRR